jgi:hypothetical protein
MPLFTVTMRSGRTVTEKDAISAAIHEASVSAGYPEDDHFQRFICLEEADLRINPLYPDLQKPRSEHVLMIEVQLSSGTEEDRKALAAFRDRDLPTGGRNGPKRRHGLLRRDRPCQ